jgi:hypothetical protein
MPAYPLKRWAYALAGLCCFALQPGLMRAQDGDLLLNDEAYHFIDRLDIRGLTKGVVPTDIKPYPREQVAELLERVDTAALRRRDRDWYLRTRLLTDDRFAEERPTGWIKRSFLKHFYTNHRDLLSYRSNDFSVFVNPILYLSYGRDNYSDPGTALNRTIWRNTRGVSVRGTLFKKVGFYGELLEQQMAVPQFMNSFVAQYGALPGEGWWKVFRTDAYDLMASKGYITYSPVKYLRIKFGKDRSFWGNGTQSLLLSDFATDYLLLNLTLKIWKLEYANQFTQMIDFIAQKSDGFGSYPAKYGAFHYLAIRPVPQVSIGIFESTIFAPTQANGTRGFNIQYLNPLIFYRTVEMYNGSPDNGQLGLMVKANIKKRVQVYYQLMIDDLNIGNTNRNGGGWWGNKLGHQFGVKWIDLFNIETLDLQAEFNTVSPFTYTHFNNGSNYAHYGQFLAHSFGANLVDFNAQLKYQPIPRLYLYLRYANVQTGRNVGGINTGGDVFNPAPPAFEFGNRTLQGQLVRTQNIYSRVSYQVGWQNLYIELESLVRRENDNNSVSLFGNLRYYIPWKPTLF